jgi:tryptophanyl-tRNA synthetase
VGLSRPGSSVSCTACRSALAVVAGGGRFSRGPADLCCLGPLLGGPLAKLSLVTLPELLRNPTVKDEAAASGMTALNGLMLTYPVHQAADILFCQATIVPVGADQLPHVEQARAIARRFNRRYAPECPVFPEPEALLGEAPVLLGTDGRKMSKSRHNAIALGATADETARMLRQAKTDSNPHITYEPAGRPEVANLVLLAALCEEIDPCLLAEQVGSRGAVELKRRVTEVPRLAASLSARSPRSPPPCTPTTDPALAGSEEGAFDIVR